MYTTAQKELAPEEDQGILFNLIKTPQGANLDYLEQVTGLDKCSRHVPEKEHVFAINGMGDVHQAFAGMLFKPWDERNRTQHADPAGAAAEGRRASPAARSSRSSSPPLPGSTGGPPVQFVITTTADYEQLAQVLDRMQHEGARTSGMFFFIDTRPQVRHAAGRGDRRPRQGRPRSASRMQDIGTSLATLLGGNYVNHFYIAWPLVQGDPAGAARLRLTPDWLDATRSRRAGQARVPLRRRRRASRVGRSRNALTRFQQLNSATSAGVPLPGRTVGEAIDFLQAKCSGSRCRAAITLRLPGRQSRQYVQEGKRLVVTFVLRADHHLPGARRAVRELPRSARHSDRAADWRCSARCCRSTLGSARVNIYTQIGLVTLIGLISKHGILMVEFANHLQDDEGMSRREAIEQAAALRLRPILMTTAAMVLGMVPLIFASGAGAASRFAIGLVIATGMSIGTLFTLFVTPAVYTYIAREHHRDAGGAHAPPARRLDRRSRAASRQRDRRAP